jgi:5-methylthioadenosine/S-adenosylhomocysteine deaminase
MSLTRSTASPGTASTARTVIRGGLLITQDDTHGTRTGDILIDDGRIVVIGTVPADDTAAVVDAKGKAVLPGFVDTHRHTWQGAFRLMGFGWDFPTYRQHVQLTWGPRFGPDDAYIGELVGILSALDAGITTVRDESHIQNSPAHTDAVVCALQDSGIRAIFAHGWPSVDSDAWMFNSTHRHLADIARVRSELLSDDNQLVTLNAMLRGPEMTDLDVTSADLALARDLTVRASMHVGFGAQGIRRLHDAGLLGPDQLFIHCCASTDDEFRMLADAGAGASVAASIEMSMPGLGMPATERLVAAGVRPSLSVDTEVCVAGDMFTVMRSAQAATVARAASNAEDSHPALSAPELLTFATRDGAAAAGLDDRVGSITVGKEADLIVIDLSAPNLAPAADPVAAIVGAGTPHNVETVMVRGRILKHRGLLHPGLSDIYQQAARSRDRILAGG